MMPRHLHLVSGPIDDAADAAAAERAQAELLRIRQLRAVHPGPLGQVLAAPGNDNARREVRRLERGER